MNNLNKFTKDELIKKLEKLENQVKKSNTNLESQIKTSEKSVNKIEAEPNSKGIWTLFLDILNKIIFLILSLSIVRLLAKIFKQYKTVRILLKLANYIIVTIFGVSIWQSFGLDWLTKFQYFFYGALAFIRDSTYYQNLLEIFNSSDSKSARELYKKQQEANDWKAKFDAVKKQREWEEWLERHPSHKNEKEDEDENSKIKAIILMLSLLGGGIAIWWWGKEILEFISPILNIGEIIRNIDRGNNPGNDPGNNAFGNNAPRNNAPENNAPQNDGVDFDEIELNDNEAMMVYAADMVDRTPTNPPAPLPPIPPTNQGPPAPVFDQEAFDKMKAEKHPVKSSYSEKMARYKEKLAAKAEELKAKTAESGGTILDEIKSGKKLKKVDLNIEESVIPGTSKSESTLREKLSSKFDKMRGNDDSDTETEKDNEEWKRNIKNKSKNKFLESIALENKIETKSTDFKNYPPALKPIIEKFPNLSKETLDKLSTPEGIKNRKAIIASLPPNELNLTPSIKSDNWDTDKFDKLVKDNLNLDSEALVKKIEKEVPGYNIDNYRSDFMKAIKDDINSGKTIEERNKIFKEYQKTDLDEIQNLGDNYKIRDIKNVVRENYTHNSLLNELKTKSSIKNLEEFKNLPPDQAFDLAKDLKGNKIDSNLLDKADKFLHSILLENIDNAMYKLITTYPEKNKQELVEQLINENPKNKEIILKRVKDTVDSGLDYMVKNLDESEFNEKIDSLMKNDLKERELINENISIDKIKILKSVNKSHSNLLEAIKNKSKEKLIDNESKENLDEEHYENTMSLFDED